MIEAPCLKCRVPFTLKAVNQRYCSRVCSVTTDEPLTAKDAHSLRWELLWKLRPDLHGIMLKIEERLKL